MSLRPEELLSTLPKGLRDPLISHYKEIARNFLERRWEPSELNAGKLCEVVYTIVDGASSGGFATKPSKPGNMVTACNALGQRAADPARVGDRSLRILIPRVLVALYEVRNNRGVSHVAGDVNPNEMDAMMVFSCSNWILCELVRIFHKTTADAAEQAVSTLVERRLPEIWQIEDVKRVLSSHLRARDQTLLLVYSEIGWVPAEKMREWIEYSNATQYRKRILIPLHKSRHIEFDQRSNRIQISPKGSVEVEEEILPSLERRGVDRA